MSILIVDDSPVMRKLVVRSLRQAGFGDEPIAEASDGVEALAAIRTSTPKVVLSDWNMPNMTGIELLEALRAEGNEVPFGFVTSETNADVLAQASGSGASFILSKPFTAEDVAAAMAAVSV